jgi:multiple sugar transport system permease protein
LRIIGRWSDAGARRHIDWGLIMAAGVMITVPTVVFFAAVQRYLVQSWTAGGVKG